MGVDWLFFAMSLTSIVLPSCNILDYSISLSILASIASDQVIIARTSNTMLCKLGSKRDHVNTRRFFICICNNNAFEQTYVVTFTPLLSLSTRCLWHMHALTTSTRVVKNIGI